MLRLAVDRESDTVAAQRARRVLAPKRERARKGPFGLWKAFFDLKPRDRQAGQR